MTTPSAPFLSIKRQLAFCAVPCLILLWALLATKAPPRASTPSARKNQSYSSMSLASKLSITDLQLKGERVLIRVDFNVP